MRHARGWAFAAALLAAACATSPFKSTWKAGEEKAVSLRGRTTAAVYLSDVEAVRRNAEQAMVEEIQARGGSGLAGYTVLDTEAASDRAHGFSLLRDRGAEFALVMRAASRERDTLRVHPWFGGGLGGWGARGSGWGWGWGVLYDPAYGYPETVVTVEIRLYALAGERLLWAGVSQARLPSDWVGFLRGLAREALARMEAEGVLY
ncbi:MAG: hypothetical protein WHT06_08410 [Desulfobacterales bacterium]